MKWVMYSHGGAGERAGLLLGDRIHGLEENSRVMDLLGDDGSMLRAAGERAENSPVEVVALADVHLAPPVRPPQMRDFLTFLDHLRNARAGFNTELSPAWDEIPTFYFTNSFAVVGANDPVAISPGCQQFDYELEVCAVIGRPGSNLHPDEAESHIAGFMIFNDWSARDLQRHEMTMTLGPAKGKDGATTLGPALVTPDELEPFRSKNSFHLEMKGFVNNELVSHGWMDQMDWSWGEIISYASRGTTLHTGEVIGSGTVPTGCLAEHFALDGPERFRGWLAPGDVVRFEVDLLGSIEQEVLPSVPVHRLRTGF